jgi:hypothetical protein
MNLKILKNTEKYLWTEHAKFKMQYYGLSPQKVLGVVHRPKRKEEGIVKDTIAVMQPISPKIINNKVTWKQEVWAMYQNKVKNKKLKVINFGTSKRQIKIISAWRYPGISPKKDPIPEEIIREIEGLK